MFVTLYFTELCHIVYWKFKQMIMEYWSSVHNIITFPVNTITDLMCADSSGFTALIWNLLPDFNLYWKNLYQKKYLLSLLPSW